MLQKLFLFDLDGTVLKVKTKKMVSIVDKTLTHVGLAHHTTLEKKFSGRTDKDIFHSYLDESNVHLYPLLKETYTQYMFNELQNVDVDLLLGVDSVCKWLVNNNLNWGLLTGNFELTGKQKILCSGFPLPVSFGLFGDDFTNRTELAAQAVQHGNAFFGKEFSPSDIVIIGDTPKDILCAKENGFISVGVTTGGYSQEELLAYQPSFVIQDLNQLIHLPF